MDMFGGGSQKRALELQKQQQESNQRRQLADLARQQAETDQAASGRTGRNSGGRMLTFLSSGSFLSGSGNNKFGQV